MRFLSSKSVLSLVIVGHGIATADGATVPITNHHRPAGETAVDLSFEKQRLEREANSVRQWSDEQLDAILPNMIPGTDDEFRKLTAAIADEKRLRRGLVKELTNRVGDKMRIQDIEAVENIIRSIIKSYPQHKSRVVHDSLSALLLKLDSQRKNIAARVAELVDKTIHVKDLDYFETWRAIVRSCAPSDPNEEQKISAAFEVYCEELRVKDREPDKYSPTSHNIVMRKVELRVHRINLGRIGFNDLGFATERREELKAILDDLETNHMDFLSDEEEKVKNEITSVYQLVDAVEAFRDDSVTAEALKNHLPDLTQFAKDHSEMIKSIFHSLGVRYSGPSYAYGKYARKLEVFQTHLRKFMDN